MSEMTPRERFLTALNHQEPDRVPLDLGGINSSLMMGTCEQLKQHLGMADQPTQLLSKTWQIAAPDEALLRRLNIDTRYLFPPLRPAPAPTDGGAGAPAADGDRFVDEWGVPRRFIFHYYDIEAHPLKGYGELDDIESYPWPEDPAATFDFSGLGARAKDLRANTDYALVGYTGGGSLFEQAWYLRGFPELLMDFMINKDYAHALLTRITDVRKRCAELYLREVGDDLDVIQFGDDISTQGGPPMSPELYREMIKPYHAELFAFVKARTRAKLYYHSCGGLMPLVEDLIEIGVDVLNPIQVTAKGMDTVELKRRFGDRLAFWGAIDSQQVLPFGSVADVRAEVQRRIRDLAPGGGYILAGVHNLQPDIVPENIVAMYDEGVRSGRYPLP